MDLDFGFPTEVTGGSFAPPQIDIPSFNFPNFGADLNIGNLAGASGMGNLNFGGLNFGSPDTSTPGTGGGGAGGGTGFDWRGAVKDASSVLGLGTQIAQIPLSIGSLSQAGRANKAVESSIATSQRAAAPGIAASEKLLPAGTDALLTGKLPPELEAAVNNQVNQVKQQLLQHLVSQGIDPATANSMIEGQLAELRNQLTLQYAESLLGGGSAAGGQAVAAAGQAGMLATGEASGAGASLQAANQALGRLVGAGA